MNFKIKHQNRINYLEPGNTSNYLNGGDPPQKKGTAYTVTSEDKLNKLVEGYQSAKTSHMAAMGADPEGKKKMIEYAEAIQRQPGGVQKWQEMTGAVGKGSITGKKITLSDVAKSKGVTETEAAGDIRRKAIEVSKSKKEQD
jgi:hypothetical protein